MTARSTSPATACRCSSGSASWSSRWQWSASAWQPGGSGGRPMKPTGLLIAAGLLAVLGGLVYWSSKREATEAKGPDSANKILSIPEDQFQEIRIKKLTGETIALSRETGKWRITEPKPLPADQDAVTSVVGALASLNADKVV